jgi:hypothetical protein
MILDAASCTNGTYWSRIWLYWFSLLRPVDAERVWQGGFFHFFDHEALRRNQNPQRRLYQAVRHSLLALLSPLRPQAAQVLRRNSQELRQFPLLE